MEYNEKNGIEVDLELGLSLAISVMRMLIKKESDACVIK